ncbi:TPA: thymidylate synthase [Staphylococcus pseudintermedius]|nr:thymidylate synthase [Staphylococcus pseudintermedius]HDT8452624.1 thymidylate synthase [Staphylococcus pseudintermedius]
MNPFDAAYHDLCKEILEIGNQRDDRTATGTISKFGHQLRFDLSKGFPLLTTKKVSFKLVATELIWFIRGDTNLRYLLQYNNNIWNEWAFEKYVQSEDYTGPDMTDFGHRAQSDAAFAETYREEMTKFKQQILTDDDFMKKHGDLGNVYGKQWRNWVSADGQQYDQLKALIEQIKANPNSRRHIISAWNPTEIEILTHLIAKECGLEVGEFVHTFGDAHIYSNHLDAVKTQLARSSFAPPELKINTDRSIFDIEYEDLEIVNYESHPAIKAPIAV